MSVARKILFNTGAQVFAKAVLAFIGVITVKIISGYLGLAGYGNYTAVYDFIAFFGIASDLGLYTIAVREMARNEEQTEKILGNVFTIRLILCIVTMALAVIASFFYGRADSTIFFPLAAAIAGTSTIFALLTGTISTVLQVHLKMQYNAVASIIGKICALSYMLYVVFLWKPEDPTTGFYHLFVAAIIGNLVLFGVTYFFANKYAKITLRFDKDFIKDVVIKALPYGLALILNNLYFRIGSIMLYSIKGEIQAGIYGVPMRVLEAIAILPLYFMNSVLPTLTRTLKEKSEKYKQVIQYSFDALVMAGVSMAIGVAVISYQIIYLISNEEFLSRVNEGFYGSDIALQILIFALAFSFINTLFGFILVAINRQSKLLFINGSGAVIAIILNLFLIPYLGARGAAITDVMVELYVAVTAFFIARHYLEFKLKLGTAFKIIFAGVVMGAVVWYLKEPTYYFIGLQNKNVLLLIPIGAVVFGGILFATKAITKEMLAMLKKK
jgi:O-antigen/teichoic acid export membrane protein